MWLLIEVKDGNDTPQQRLLYPGKTYSIGRKDSTITIEDDKSVSRKHANVTVEDTNNDVGLQNVLDPIKRSSVTLRDEGAKYGTFVNTSKISPHQPYVLRDNDLIKFGTLTSLWRLTWFPVVICCSGLRSSEKERVYRSALELDIKISKTWVSGICTHLYMKEVRPTEKALLAIADLCPIISLSWVECIKANRESINFQFPPIEEHQPPLNSVCESVPEKPNFLPMQRRKSVFADTTFYLFSEEQYHRMLPVVSKCSGDVVLCQFGAKPWDTQESIQQLIAKDIGSIVVYPPSSEKESYNAYHTKWKSLFAACSRLGERLVAEVEIGWAVVFGTTNVYCNKFGPDPMNDSLATNMPSHSGESSHKRSEGSSTAASAVQPSSFASDLSTPVVRSRITAAPSWVLGDIAEDIESVRGPEPSAAQEPVADVPEQSTNTIGSHRRAQTARNPEGRAPKRSLNSFFDSMFDDLVDVEKPPPPKAQLRGSPSEPEASVSNPAPTRTGPAIMSDEEFLFEEDHSMPRNKALVDEPSAGESSISEQVRQKTPSLAEINSRPWGSSDEEEPNVHVAIPESSNSHDNGNISFHDVEMDDAENEDSIVASITNKQKMLKAEAQKSRDEAAEEDEAFETEPGERYSTIIVQSLVKTPPSGPRVDTPATTNDHAVNYKRFRKATTQQQVNEMSFIRMLPHDQIRSAIQDVYWLQRDNPQRKEVTGPGSQGGEKLTFD